jgi:methylenetetrahydrofolate--tRNA-(uracil-5-)-methyltransferase
MTQPVAIVGAGLAGSEAALVLARNGFTVDLFEMRPGTMTPAHKTDLPAELVCSNSLKAQGINSAHALLKDELATLDSPLLRLARECAVPAGSALAVDRILFSQAVLKAITDSPGIRFVRQEVDRPPDDHQFTVIAAGPLASDRLTKWIAETFAQNSLFFYDAIAPIVSADSVDMTKAFFAERDNPESTDYINGPFSKDEYQRFFDELTKADSVSAHEFEEARFFEACLPVEVIARRGFKSLAFGPLKPIDLVDPRTGRRPYAVCQLRRENRAGDSYNMVGFQTRLRVPEQQRVFRMIPGLEKAEFLRFGSIHRNTYVDSPRLLSGDLSFRTMSNVFLAGQICGSEGYTESIATGHLAALAVLAKSRQQPLPSPPLTTALGSLLNHVTHSADSPFSPSNVNFGLFPAIQRPGEKKLPKMERNARLCTRAKQDLAAWLDGAKPGAVC